jgi:hypothetical protein
MKFPSLNENDKTLLLRPKQAYRWLTWLTAPGWGFSFGVCACAGAGWICGFCRSTCAGASSAWAAGGVTKGRPHAMAMVSETALIATPEMISVLRDCMGEKSPSKGFIYSPILVLMASHPRRVAIRLRSASLFHCRAILRAPMVGIWRPHGGDFELYTAGFAPAWRLCRALRCADPLFVSGRISPASGLTRRRPRMLTPGRCPITESILLGNRAMVRPSGPG